MKMNKNPSKIQQIKEQLANSINNEKNGLSKYSPPLTILKSKTFEVIYITSLLFVKFFIYVHF